MGRKIAIFDLDGTFVNTAPDLLDSLNHSLMAGGVEPLPSNGFQRFVGHGGRAMIERAYAAHKAHARSR